MKKIFLLLVVMMAFMLSSFAVTLSFKFDGSGFISDGAEILKQQDADEIAFYLDYVKKQKKYTVLFVTIDSIEGLPASRVAHTVAQHVNIPDKENLMVFLVSPGDGKIGIEVGENMKSDISYATLSKIIQSRIAPSFNSGDYSEAMKLGIYSISQTLEPSLAFVDIKNAIKKPVDNTSSSQQLPANTAPFSIVLLGLFALLWLNAYSTSKARERALVYHRCGFGNVFGNVQLLFE